MRRGRGRGEFRREEPDRAADRGKTLPRHLAKAERWKMKETGAPVLYSEYEPCLEAMERERRKGVEVEEEEGEKSRERKGAEGIGSVFGTRDGRGRRRDWRSRAVMVPASVRENRGRHFLRVLFGTLYATLHLL